VREDENLFPRPARYFDLFPDDAKDLLEVRGSELVDKLGETVVRDIVADILTGVNVRNATEALTRRRIAKLNTALLVLFERAREEDPDFPRNLPRRAKAELDMKGISNGEKRVLWWLLGLTKKQIDNVLRSDPEAWEEYLDLYAKDLEEVAESAESSHAAMNGDWVWTQYLLQTIGTQERATRGSEKSMYGKFFEKLVLAGVLHVLGFTIVPEEDPTQADQVFWLSTRGDKRESDATALFTAGQGVRFDIGFIGTGNSEITLDKTSRFERQVEINGRPTFMGTIVIVDRIGTNSRVPRLAEEAEASVVQMSASHWPRHVGAALETIFPDYTSPFAALAEDEYDDYIEQRMKSAPFDDLLIAAEQD
jgi:CfrBI-like restriction endonuclease